MQRASLITPDFVRTMAKYNGVMNRRLYEAAGRLSDEERRKDRGAFWSSIHGTLNHLLWADQLWIKRFAGVARPAAVPIEQSPFLCADWDTLSRERFALDGAIIAWANGLDASWIEDNLTWYSSSAQRELTRPKALIVAHFFNHQTHHRGQVHAMLTQCGLRPGDTDLPLML